MNFFVPITKVDTVKREVWGVAAEEAPDKSGEVMDYALSKPNFVEWSTDISKATDGKSVGNLRSMHTNIAAGKLIDMSFDDSAKKVLVGARVVDDQEWRKVTEGVYTGFSIGGSYGKRWVDNGLIRYEAKPVEVSLVDNPCMYGAQFSVIKADGEISMSKFVGGADEAQPSPESVEAPNEDLAKLAAQVDELTKAGQRHSAADMALINEIGKKVHALGATSIVPAETASPVKTVDVQPVAVKAADGELKKDMDDEPSWLAFAAGYNVSDLASALAFVSQLAGGMANVDADCAQKLSSAAEFIASALADKVAQLSEATAQAVVDEKADEAMAAKVEAATAAVDGADAQPVADDADKAAEDDMNKAQLVEEVKQAVIAEILAKAKEAEAGDLAKRAANDEKLDKRFDDVAARLGALEQRIAKAEHPASGPVLRDVTGATGGASDDRLALLDSLIEKEVNPTIRQAYQNERATLAMKQAHSRGVLVNGNNRR